VLKPGGGIACFGQPVVKDYSPDPIDLQKLADEWATLKIKEPEIISKEDKWIMFTRLHLAGAGGWTHQYADPANTSCSDDKLVMAPFSTLWYGSPGPQLIPDRHARASSPVALDGKLIVEGEDVIMAYDAYNGTLLWERKIKGANRVRVDADGGNMAINHYGLFVAVNDMCLQLDTETGETVQTFHLPPAWKGKPRRWGYIAVKDNILFGSVAKPLNQEYAEILGEIIKKDGSWIEREELAPTEAMLAAYYKHMISENAEEVEMAMQRDGTKWRSITDFPDWNPGIRDLTSTSKRIMSSDGIFAVNIETGNILWTHQGKEIAQITISMGDNDLYFAENAVSYAQKQKALNEKQRNIQKGNWEEFGIELGLDEADIRIVYSLDILSGKKKWEKAIDLSGCGDDMTASGYHNGVLLFFGSYGLHDKWRFPAGELKWHRITAVSAENGDLMWSRPLNYMVRPLIIKDEIIIEPRKCDLYTGEIKTRVHPVTGKQVPWEFYRPGHTCAATSSTENCLFYRSYNSAYYDLKEDKGLNYYGAIRPGCWINMIPGNGLVLFPEASSGCTCSFPIRTSVVLKPESREEVEDWSLYISHAPLTPVKQLAINLGAPGDMKDKNGTIWFGYPRPDMGLGLKLDLNEEIIAGMGYYSFDSKGVDIEGTDYSWLFTNGCVGFLTCQIPLINNLFGEEAGIFTIRLGFAAPSTNRNFDIKIQDNTVMENLDVLKESGGVNNVLIKEFKGINVVNNLLLELVPEITDPEVNQAPVINFIEVIREDTPGTSEPSEEDRIIYAGEAKKILVNAGIEYEDKDFENALNKYHMVLQGSTIKELKMNALEGMEKIASHKSLPVIKKYCQKLDPIMWDYKEPDQELLDAADRVYTAIASNLPKEE
ncbi:malectin domain-containing carbohydrate-binding protein, partial [Bacteroidota bacterium]